MAQLKDTVINGTLNVNSIISNDSNKRCIFTINNNASLAFSNGFSVATPETDSTDNSILTAVFNGSSGSYKITEISAYVYLPHTSTDVEATLMFNGFTYSGETYANRPGSKRITFTPNGYAPFVFMNRGDTLKMINLKISDSYTSQPIKGSFRDGDGAHLISAESENSGTVVIGRSPSSCVDGQTLINAGTTVDNSWMVAIGSANKVYAYSTKPTSGLVANTSDRRDKADFKAISNSLEFINKLEPVTFTENYRDNYVLNGVFDEELYKKRSIQSSSSFCRIYSTRRVSIYERCVW